MIYDPEAVIRDEQALRELGARLHAEGRAEDAAICERGVGRIVAMWCKLALVRRAVK